MFLVPIRSAEPWSAKTNIAGVYWQFHPVLDLVGDSVLSRSDGRREGVQCGLIVLSA